MMGYQFQNVKFILRSPTSQSWVHGNILWRDTDAVTQKVGGETGVINKDKTKQQVGSSILGIIC
jgi:hypothetical protein